MWHFKKMFILTAVWQIVEGPGWRTEDHYCSSWDKRWWQPGPVADTLRHDRIQDEFWRQSQWFADGLDEMQVKARSWIHPGIGSDTDLGRWGSRKGKWRALLWLCLLEVLIRYPKGNMEWADFKGGMKLRFLWTSAYRTRWGHLGSECGEPRKAALECPGVFQNGEVQDRRSLRKGFYFFSTLAK